MFLKSVDDLAIWGGIECTFNRVGDGYIDQCELSGHDMRSDDLAKIAALGIKTMRYPVIWEKIAPNGLATADWTLTDERLTQLRALGIEPIVGLCHHGSGPRQTDLLDADFPIMLAEFAGAVAARYPWLKYFTPVNEPLTTARFSCLYGHWYPHKSDDSSFLKALLVQCKAVVLSMQAIRKVTPAAELVQTEDLGKTYSTTPLNYQRDFENNRRWLTFDLLCGRSLCATMQSYFDYHGIAREETEWFGANICEPDIIGVNHYVTSERFLDHRFNLYPPQCVGGNGRDMYADIEAVRADLIVEGLEGILDEALERYGLPIVITEAHIGDSAGQQKKWLLEVWKAAQRCRSRGGDVRAVTTWALLGSYFWNTLVTQNSGNYEPGAFDVTDGTMQPTALTDMIRSLAGRGMYAEEDAHFGWWKREDRYYRLPIALPRRAAKKAREKYPSYL